MHFFGCLGILLFVILFLIIGAVRSILSAAFGLFTPKADKNQHHSRYHYRTPHDREREHSRDKEKGTGSVFDDSDGEYIDFEELN